MSERTEKKTYSADDRNGDVAYISAALSMAGRRMSDEDVKSLWQGYSSSLGSEWKRLENYSFSDIQRALGFGDHQHSSAA